MTGDSTDTSMAGMRMVSVEQNSLSERGSYLNLGCLVLRQTLSCDMLDRQPLCNGGSGSPAMMRQHVRART